MQGPETRESLIQKISDPEHQEAWSEFVQVYQPLIYNFALSKGMQHSDALDIVQEVLTAVSGSVGKFQKRTSGSFRGYLFAITRNLLINRITRGQKHRGSGDRRVHSLLDAVPEDTESSREFDLQRKREVFRWAARRIKNRVTESTWQGFWLTTMDGMSIRQAAEQIGKSNGAVRIARCRVTALLRDEVKPFLDAEANTPQSPDSENSTE